jgi:cell cycle arrest protein BUB2
MNVLNAAKRSGSNKPVFSLGHLSLQQIVRDGPTDGDYVGALETARWKVIDEGVNAAEDGMVRPLAAPIASQSLSLQADILNL